MYSYMIMLWDKFSEWLKKVETIYVDSVLPSQNARMVRDSDKSVKW